jgi:DnaJ-class molecular chaperone
MEPKTYYEILEVSELASTETIRAAYRSLSKRFHPDNKKTGSEERFKVLTEAHECLIDGGKRKEYDRELQRSRAPKESAPKAKRASRQKEAHQPQASPNVPAFDPTAGVNALFALGNVVMQRFEVDPFVHMVFTQVQPDLEQLAVEGVRRMVGV